MVSAIPRGSGKNSAIWRRARTVHHGEARFRCRNFRTDGEMVSPGLIWTGLREFKQRISSFWRSSLRTRFVGYVALTNGCMWRNAPEIGSTILEKRDYWDHHWEAIWCYLHPMKYIIYWQFWKYWNIWEAGCMMQNAGRKLLQDVGSGIRSKVGPAQNKLWVNGQSIAAEVYPRHGIGTREWYMMYVLLFPLEPMRWAVPKEGTIILSGHKPSQKAAYLPLPVHA